jgi:transcriptional regulator with XRE-family HTH domain
VVQNHCFLLRDNILAIILNTPKEVMGILASHAKAARLALGLTQAGLGSRSGVSLGSIKRFERTGQVSLESLLKIATVLGNLENFTHVFATKNKALPGLDVLMKVTKKRKRGSIK